MEDESRKPKPGSELVDLETKTWAIPEKQLSRLGGVFLEGAGTGRSRFDPGCVVVRVGPSRQRPIVRALQKHTSEPCPSPKKPFSSSVGERKLMASFGDRDRWAMEVSAVSMLLAPCSELSVAG